MRRIAMIIGHDDLPEKGELSEQELAEMFAALSNPRCDRLRDLSRALRGKQVEGTECGNSGFLLRFADSTWLIAYMSGAVMEAEYGTGPADDSALERIAQNDYGSASQPLQAYLPYASEHCDCAAELRKCIGKIVTGLAIGPNSFNVCFPENRELDVTIVPVGDQLGYRVFWEQW